MYTPDELHLINQNLKNKTPLEIVKWAVNLHPGRALVSTHFGPQEAVILHLCHSVDPQIPVLWADTGHNTRYTYSMAHKFITQYNLNVKIFVPRTTLGYQDAYYGGIPSLDQHEAHDQFTKEVKLEPFERGLAELNPKVWLTTLRKDQTEFRSHLDIVSLSKTGLIKVSPVFHWTQADMEAYLASHNLPNETRYFDPTKVDSKRECGLHPGV